MCAWSGGTPATTEHPSYTHTWLVMLLTHSSVCLSCLITASVQTLETAAQTPSGRRLTLKCTLRPFLKHVLRVLITEFTFHPRTSSQSLGIGRASVPGLHVDTGSDRRANRETQNRHTLRAHYGITADYLFKWTEQCSAMWCSEGPHRSLKDTPRSLGVSEGGGAVCTLLLTLRHIRQLTFLLY